MPLRLRRLEVIVVRAPLGEDIPMSFGRMRSRQSLLVRLSDDEGRVGVGECWANWPAWAPEERLVLFREGIAPLLADVDLDDWSKVARHLHSQLARQYVQAGSPGPLWHAVGAIDQALWDMYGSPLAPDATVEVYGSGIGPDNVERDSRRAAEFGVGTVKVRVGFDLAADLRNVATAREILGADVVVAVDANQNYDLAAAIVAARAFSAAGVGWIEEPVAGDRLDDLRRLHEETGMVVATGENVYDLDDHVARAATPGIALLQPDVTKLGGISRTVELVDRVADFDVEVAPHMYGGPVGLAATLRLALLRPTVSRIEYDLRANPLAAFPRPDKGRLAVFPDHTCALTLMDAIPSQVHEIPLGTVPSADAPLAATRTSEETP